jgi:biotin carboxyl carrier protein
LNNPQPEASTESSTAQETLPDQKSIDQSLVLLKQSLLQSLSDTEQRLEKAKLDYELLKTTHATQLSNLEHSLQTARNEYETAYTTYNKLTIRAPLAGTIADILVSAGDTVREGTPLFTLLPNAAVPSIQVQLSFEEYLTVLTATDVDIILPITTADTVSPITTVGTGLALSENNTKQTTENNITEKTITGKITSRSPTTNEEGNYTLSIETSNEPLPLSEIIEIQFPIKTS